MSGWVHDLWVAGVSVGFDTQRHWVYLIEGSEGEDGFESRAVGWFAIQHNNMPPNAATTMALVANSVSGQMNDLEHGPIQCLMTNGLELDSRIMQIQTI